MFKSKTRTMTSILSILLSLFLSISFAQKSNYNLTKLAQKVDSLFEITIESEHIPGATIIIVKDGEVLLKKGYGYTSLGENINHVNPDSTIFRIGSITKTFTATALLQLVDKGKIGLNEDINKYLKSIKVPSTFKEPITVHHLLTHSAGFDEIGGRRVFQEHQQIPLATFLSDKLIRIQAAGKVTSYSTYAIALAGLLIEDISGQPLEEYMKEHIWDPLGMSMTSIKLPEEHMRYLSLGYEYYKGVNLPQPWEWYHTFPASSINSTAMDMAKFMQMHLNLGKLASNRILSTTISLKMQE